MQTDDRAVRPITSGDRLLLCVAAPVRGAGLGKDMRRIGFRDILTGSQDPELYRPGLSAGRDEEPGFAGLSMVRIGLCASARTVVGVPPILGMSLLAPLERHTSCWLLRQRSPSIARRSRAREMEYRMSQKRRITLGIVVVAALTISYMIGRQGSKASSSSAAVRHVLYYVDPMHPSYRSDKPGIAPDCGMKLEPVYAEDVARFSATVVAPATLPAGAVSVDRGMQKLLGIRLASVEKGSSRNTVEVVGRVVPEDQSVYKLNSGVDGFIQNTFDDSVGTRVKKDQKLATYYSPEFLAVASGFLAASERVPGSVGTDGNRTVPYPGTVSKQGVSSLQGYTDRLRNLGMSEVQIRHIAESRQLPENIDVVSPVNGFILARNINAGQHFDHDMEFYRIADLSRVWVLAEMGEQEAAQLHPGDPATIALSGIGRELSAKITDSLPQSEVGGGTVKLRLEVFMPPSNVLRKKVSCRLNWASRLRNAAVEQSDSFASLSPASRKSVTPSGP